MRGQYHSTKFYSGSNKDLHTLNKRLYALYQSNLLHPINVKCTIKQLLLLCYDKTSVNSKYALNYKYPLKLR